VKWFLSRVAALVRLFYGYSVRMKLRRCGTRFLPGFPLTVKAGQNIRIGNNFRSMGHDYLYADEGSIEIGDNMSMNTNVQIGASSGKIVIGNNVLIGPNVVLRAADHGLSKDAAIASQAHNSGVITIEDDVWIGANAVILRNVRLGQGCVVAAGAVVTKDVAALAVVGGVPARKISLRA
jgi:galactoside O-acetyltransferase